MHIYQLQSAQQANASNIQLMCLSQGTGEGRLGVGGLAWPLAIAAKTPCSDQSFSGNWLAQRRALIDSCQVLPSRDATCLPASTLTAGAIPMMPSWGQCPGHMYVSGKAKRSPRGGRGGGGGGEGGGGLSCNEGPS